MKTNKRTNEIKLEDFLLNGEPLTPPSPFDDEDETEEGENDKPEEIPHLESSESFEIQLPNISLKLGSSKLRCDDLIDMGLHIVSSFNLRKNKLPKIKTYIG